MEQSLNDNHRCYGAGCAHCSEVAKVNPRQRQAFLKGKRHIEDVFGNRFEYVVDVPTEFADTLTYRVLIKKGHEVDFTDLSRLSEVFKTKKINIMHDRGFCGSDVTPASPDEFWIYIDTSSS